MKYDIVIAGAGQAGICAAIAAAESGAHVLLINDRPVLGGNASSECGVPAHGAEALGHNRSLRETGIMEEIRLDFYCRLSPNASDIGAWSRLLKERCERCENLTLLENTAVIGAFTDGSRITSVQLSNGETVTADIFIDATGDGTLGCMAGAEYRIGREARDEFGERILGRDKADSHTLGCSIYGHAVKRDRPVPYTPPEDAVRYPDCASLAHRSHDVKSLFPKLTCNAEHTALNFFWWLEWGGELDVIRDKDIIYRHLKSELFGVWDHLKNHCNLETRKALECFELTGWTAFPMKRESRRLVGDYILNENDVADGRLFDDTIGYGGWPMDDHPPMGIQSHEPGCDQIFLSKPYTVPYRCCYSRNIANLFMVGRCISVTHAALSSVRVMNTLSAIAEAIGIAAAMCVKEDRLPKEVNVRELQKRVFERDLYIPYMTPEDGIAEQAEVKLSSSRSLAGVTEAEGGIPLTYDTALRFPVSTDHIDALSVRLAADTASEVSYSVFCGNTVNENGETLLAKGSISVGIGTDDYHLLSAPVSISGSVITVILEKEPQVRWLFGNEQYHTRWAVRFLGEQEGLSFHGAAHIVNNSPWTTVNGSGRMPKEIALWLRDIEGRKIHDKLYATPCFTVSPVQYPYGEKALQSTILRSAELPNLWISGKGLPQSAQYSWKEPVTFSKVELFFDTNLDYSDQRYGFPRGYASADLAMPEVIEETVSDCAVEFRFADGGTLTKHICGNIYRRRILDLGTPAKLVSVRLTVTKTRGCGEARLFGVRFS